MAVQQSNYHSIHGVTERSTGRRPKGERRACVPVVPSLSPANHRPWSPVKLTPLTTPDCFTAVPSLLFWDIFRGWITFREILFLFSFARGTMIVVSEIFFFTILSLFQFVVILLFFTVKQVAIVGKLEAEIRFYLL